MTVKIDREYKLKCLDCDFTADASDYAAALDVAEEHLHVGTVDRGMANYNHSIEVVPVDIVRNRRW